MSRGLMCSVRPVASDDRVDGTEEWYYKTPPLSGGSVIHALVFCINLCVSCLKQRWREDGSAPTATLGRKGERRGVRSEEGKRGGVRKVEEGSGGEERRGKERRGEEEERRGEE